MHSTVSTSQTHIKDPSPAKEEQKKGFCKILDLFSGFAFRFRSPVLNSSSLSLLYSKSL